MSNRELKVVAINGSARKDGNTAILIRYVFRELKKEGIETELVQLAGHNLKGCQDCFKCFETKDKRCAIKNDIVNECIEKMFNADGIILGSPTYSADATANLRALMERAGRVSRANDVMFKRKVGVPVVAARRTGGLGAFDSINHFFLVREMIITSAHSWNIGFGFKKGEVEKDKEGLRHMKTLGQNMAWLMKKIYG